MSIIHFWLAITVVAGYLLLTILSGRVALKTPAAALAASFWRLLAIVQGLTLVQAAFGVWLYAQGLRPAQSLHIMYGGVVVLLLLLQWGMKPGSGYRQALTEQGKPFSEAMTYAALVAGSFLITGRALMTGLGL